MLQRVLRLTPAILPALAATLLVCSGCESVRIAKHRIPVDGAASIQGPLAVDVSNIRGSVDVVVKPELTEPIVTARRLPAEGFDRVDMIKPDWVAAEISQDGPASVLRVLTTQTGEVGDGVAIVIMTPSCSGLRVRNAGGPVTATGVAGAIDVQNGSVSATGGSITITTRADLDAPVALVTTSGSVTLDAGAGTRGDITITAPSRRAVVDAPGANINDIKANTDRWTGTVNGGGHQIVLDAGGGWVYLTLD